MKRRGRWSFFWILIPVLALGVFFLVSVYYLIDPDLYRNVIQKSLTLNLGREVSIGKAKISLWGGIGIAFEDLRVKDRSLSLDLLQSKRLILKVKMIPLLRKEIQWKRIVLDRPILRIVKDKDGHLNFPGDSLKGSEQNLIQILSTLFGGSFTIRNGEISFSDESLGGTPLMTEIRSFNFQLSEVSYHQTFPFRMAGRVWHSEREGRFLMEGSIRDIPKDLDLSKGKLEAKVELNGIEFSHFWPYLKPWLPMKAISGSLDLSGQYQGSLSEGFKASAKIKFSDLLYDHPQVFASVLSPKWVNIGVEVECDLKEIRVPRLSVELPEIGVKARGKIYGIGTKEVGMEAVAESTPFDLADAKRLIPYRVITREVSDSLLRAEGSGSIQIVSVKLSGRMREIDHCDEPVNAHTLSVEIRLNGARLKFPWNLPPLDDLRGSLVFRDGHLNLKDLTGKVFRSTLEKVNGRFHQLLVVPTLEAQWDGRLDLTDLPALLKTDLIAGELADALSSVNVQSGRAEYHLGLKGIVMPPYRFQHQEVYRLSRVRLSHRQIPFPVLIGEGRIDLSNEVVQWAETRVEFGNCSLLTSGLRRQGERVRPLEVTARGRVDLKNLMTLSQSPFFPKEFQTIAKGFEGLSGTGQVSFKARSLTGSPSLSFEGEFAPKEVSFFPKGISSPLVLKEGVLSFSNLGVGFSRLKVQLYNSLLSLDGSVKEGNVRLSARGSVDLRYLPSLLQLSFFPDQVRTQMQGVQELSGEAEVRFRWAGDTRDWLRSLKEGEVRLKGVSLRHRALPVPISQAEGSLFLSPEQFRFLSLKGMLGNSQIMLSGGVPRPFSVERTVGAPSSAQPPKSGETRPPTFPSRWISFQVSSPELDLDPFLPKKTDPSPASYAEVSDWLARWKIEGKIEADQVTYRGLAFQEFKVGLKSVDGKLLLYPFQFKGAGGDLWGEGWFESAGNGIRFEAKPRFSNMEAKAFLRGLFQKGEGEKVELTGRVHLDKVDLLGEGENFQEVKQSLNGSLRLDIENGVIERANILSKIFSILNVSQLFMGRFPDLKSRGLPYHRITADIQVKNGVASTEDLVVDSDAMKITLVGKVDLARNLIDARIGVHPLVTLDTVLSKVPIAGYILTGKDKAFLSYVYEVKGDLDDPKMEAIPVKSMGEGIFGIFKRLLETPARPFQGAPYSTQKEGEDKSEK